MGTHIWKIANAHGIFRAVGAVVSGSLLSNRSGLNPCASGSVVFFSFCVFLNGSTTLHSEVYDRTGQCTAAADCLKRVRKLMQGDRHIGRSATQRNLEASLFNNPYKVAVFGRSEAIRRYEILLRKDGKLWSLLAKLSGTRLVCHCQLEPTCLADSISVRDSQKRMEEEMKQRRHAQCCNSVVHASCDAGHSASCHLSASIGGVVHLGYDARHSLPHHLSAFIRGVMRERCDACSLLHAAEVALRCI